MCFSSESIKWDFVGNVFCSVSMKVIVPVIKKPQIHCQHKFSKMNIRREVLECISAESAS